MTAFLPVADPEDPRIEGFRAVRERDLVGRQGLFVAEGAVVLRHLAGDRSRHEAVAFLCAEDRTEQMASLVGKASAAPVFVASQGVMDRIVGFPIHRGLLGLGRRRDQEPSAVLRALPTGRATVLALHGISNHDNMGGLFRNAAAFGVDAVLLDSTCCDPLYRKALRVSVGAALLLPYARIGAEQDMVGLLEEARLAPVALSPAGRTPLSEWRPAGRSAVIFGAEGPGLPAELLARCETLAIPMAAGFDSLNVATTSGIVLHHRVSAGG